MRQLGPHSRPNVLAKLDGRRREARLMQNVRDELTQHLGGKPSITQRALIERAAWLTLHVSMFDAKLMEGGDALPSERDGRQYLAWSNSLTRVLRQLGTDRAPAKSRRSAAEIFANRGDAAA